MHGAEMSDLAKRLTDRAAAFNDAGLTYGVADLLTEAATEVKRAEAEIAALRAQLIAKPPVIKVEFTNQPMFDAVIAAGNKTLQDRIDRAIVALEAPLDTEKYLETNAGSRAHEALGILKP